MAKPEKAQIKYNVVVDTSNASGESSELVEKTIRFHSVISEEHEVKSEITKFPIQEGFNISNHAIKKNRLVTISGIVTNTQIADAEEFYEYGKNNQKVMFETLKELVRQATVCDVTTNLGRYNPVIFTKFKTKQMQGMTDAMTFTMYGEEVQLATTVNNSTPTLVVFKKLEDQKRDARVQELIKAGIHPADDAVISEGTVDINNSFALDTVNRSGKAYQCTYEKVGYDHTTDEQVYVLHTSDTDVVEESVSSELNIFEFNKDVADVSTAAACLTEGLVREGLDSESDEIDTTQGKLRKTVHGAATKVFGLKGNRNFGQVLLGVAVECFVLGSTSEDSNSEDRTGRDIVDRVVTSTPTVDDVILGATSIGNEATSDNRGRVTNTTITKISQANMVDLYGNSV